MAEHNPEPLPGCQNDPVADFKFATPKLDEFEDALSNSVQPHKLMPLSRQQPLDSVFQLHGMPNLGVFNVRFGLDLAARLPPVDNDDRIAFAMASVGRGQLLMGRDEFAFSDRHGVFIDADCPRTLQFIGDNETVVLVMDRHRVADYCAKLLGRDLPEQVQFDRQMSLDNEAGQSWLRAVQYASSELAHPSSMVRSVPAVRQNLEQMLITTLLLGHSHNYSHALLQPQAASAPFYVKRAEAYIEAHFANPLSLADIAAHAAVSARSLQSGFQAFRNTTPMAFLRTVRLQHAHRTLLQADPTVFTVTEIAMSSGFSHMGEFSTAYKRVYGVSPSKTLSGKDRV